MNQKMSVTWRTISSYTFTAFKSLKNQIFFLILELFQLTIPTFYWSLQIFYEFTILFKNK